MARKTYSKKRRAEALALYREHGAAETARRTRIPKGTLTSWAKRAGVQSAAAEKTRAATEAAKANRAHEREELRARILEMAADVLERIGEGSQVGHVELVRPTAGAVRDYAMAFAILLDKFRLEVGEATGREEVNVSDARERLARRIDELASRRTAKEAARHPVPR